MAKLNLLTMKEVADQLGVGIGTIRHLALTAQLSGFKIGREWRFRPEDVDIFLTKLLSKRNTPALPKPAAPMPPPAPVAKISNTAVIVTRHYGAVEWVRKHLPEYNDAPVIGFASKPEIMGKIVIGALPFRLACLALKVGIIELPNLSSDQRGTDLSAEDMEEAGARLVWYSVKRIAEESRPTKEK
jgi:putative CRISPR-associated protein (TIGR02620 family)